MNYVILEKDGSVLESSLDDYIQRGSDKANHVKVAFVDSRRDGLSARLACALPNGTNINVTGVADYFNYKNKDFLGWDIPLSLAVTLYAGQVSCSLTVTDSVSGVLVQYPFTITVNESGYPIDDESLDTKLTVEEYNSLYRYIQSIKGDIVTVNSKGSLPAYGFEKTLYIVKLQDTSSYVEAYVWDGANYRGIFNKKYITDEINLVKSNCHNYADTKKSEAISTSEAYADEKKSEAIATSKAYTDEKKAEAVSTATSLVNQAKFQLVTQLLPRNNPVLIQMDQSDNAVTSRAYVTQAISQAIEDADDSHITGISFSETSRGVWVLTVNRKDLDPLTAQFDIPESMILDTTNPPRLEGTNLILTFQGGSTVSVDMTGLVDVYTGFEGSTITTTVENNVIKATLKQTWVDFLNTAESSEATRVSNENTRISNESARQTAESSRASAELQRGKAFMFNQTTRQNAFESSQTTRENTFNSKLTEWGNDYSTAKAGWNSQVQAIVTEYGRQPATEQEIRGLRTNG